MKKVGKRFTSRGLQEPPTNLKEINILQSTTGTLKIRYIAYTSNTQLPFLAIILKSKRNRQFTEEEHKTIRTIAGELAWIATCSIPQSAFSASVALKTS